MKYSAAKILFLNFSYRIAASWNKRFVEQRIGGFYNRHIGQVATVLTPEVEARILEATRRRPGDGETHWSTRNVVVHLEISHTMVTGVWQKHGLKPHWIERSWPRTMRISRQRPPIS
jgi:hypothetical protein